MFYCIIASYLGCFRNVITLLSTRPHKLFSFNSYRDSILFYNHAVNLVVIVYYVV